MRHATVLVPGLGLDQRAWDGVRHRLSSPSSVTLLPSFGLRVRAGDDLTVQAQAERLLHALARQSPDAVVAVGHSASCPVAVEAARRSARVAGLVLIGPTTDPRARTWPRMVGKWVRTATHEKAHEIPVVVPQYRRTGLPSIVRGMDAARAYRTDEAVAALDLPVVVLRGSRDRIAPHDWSTRLAEQAGGVLRTVHGAAHMVPLTHPESVAAAVGEVLDVLDRPGARPVRAKPVRATGGRANG